MQSSAAAFTKVNRLARMLYDWGEWGAHPKTRSTLVCIDGAVSASIRKIYT